MKNRIKKLFEQKRDGILSLYITAGFPSLGDTLAIVEELDAAGVDMIEIGFPFSDPLADGEAIQQSSEAALSNGMSLAVLFKQLQALRSVTQLPVLLMGYLNPVLQFGEENFINQCRSVGIDGIIIPDMPLAYYQENLQGLCIQNELSNILLITPQTSVERVREIDANSDGFIYMVSSNSITGATNSMSMHTGYPERTKNLKLDNPALIGFGIHDNHSFTEASKYSNGCIVGSAFIRHISKAGISTASIRQFINTIRS